MSSSSPSVSDAEGEVATTVLHVEELTVSYLRSDRTLATVVSGVGFEVDQGEVLGLAGAGMAPG